MEGNHKFGSPWNLKRASRDDLVAALNIIPEFLKIASECKDLEEARKKSFQIAAELEEKAYGMQNFIDRALALNAIHILKNIIARENEKISGFSTLKVIIDALNGNETVSEGFVEELKHLFLAIKGQTNYPNGWLSIKFDSSKKSGRDAALERSEFLDKLSQKVNQFISRFPTGLDHKIIEKREHQKKELMEFFGINQAEWADYRWQFSNVFKGKRGVALLRELVADGILKIPEEDLKQIDIAVENKIPWGITPHYLNLFDFKKPYVEDLHVRRQVIPPAWYVQNMIRHKNERATYFDFMGEHDTSPHDLITRRYVSISILKPYDSCPQVCVYCQRNWEVVPPLDQTSFPNWKRIEAALEWFASHKSMIDVLLTGGDPFVLGNRIIEKIMDRLAAMDHVINIRWGSRIPVTVPMRITPEFAELLGSYVEAGRRNVSISTHIETCYEITPEVAKASDLIRKQGIVIYNQHVYQRSVSRRFELVALRIALRKIGIEPYYAFYPKGKMEQKDYLIPLARLVQERKEEARLLPGQFRQDEPVFNVPKLGKNHLRAYQDRELIAIKPDGSRVYLFHPWEKGISRCQPYCYVDVPIKEYLDYLEKNGEKITDYNTIWYYY